MNKKVEDSHLPISDLKQGLYHVGDKVFNSKLRALFEASQTNQIPSWDFSHSIFEHCCKKPRTGVPLLELYRRRALQLREKYDYLILAYSGGADSDNILQAFVDNNIKLDEVWTDWPIEIVEKSGYRLNYSVDPKNMPAEFELVIKPALEKLRETNPEIKIHFSDSNKKYFNQLPSEETQLTVFSAAMSLPSIYRHTYIQSYVTTELQSKNSCIIIGVDKCIPYAKNGVYGFILSDTPTFLKSNSTPYGNPYTYEYFYWTPDLPDIAVEQARLVWDYLLANKSFLKNKMDELFNNSSLWMDREKSLDQQIKYVTYPKWDFSKFQVAKSGLVANEHFYLFSTFKDTRAVQGGDNILNNLLSGLNKELCFDSRPDRQTELKPFYNFHKLGVITDV